MKRHTPLLILLLFSLLVNGGLLLFSYHAYRTAYQREADRLMTDSAAVGELLVGRVSQPLLQAYLTEAGLSLGSGTSCQGAHSLPPECWSTLRYGPAAVTRLTRDGKTYLLFPFRINDTLVGGPTSSVIVPGGVDDSLILIVGDFVLMREITPLLDTYRRMAVTLLTVSLLLTVAFDLMILKLLGRLSPVTVAGEISETTSAPAPRRARATADLGELCHRAWESLFEKAAEGDVTLSGAAVPGCPVAGEASALTSFLAALLETVLAAQPAGGAMSLLVSRSADTVSLTLTADLPPEEALGPLRLTASGLGAGWERRDGGLTLIWEVAP